MARLRDRARLVVDLFRDAGSGFSEHAALRMAAALSYYTIFSLAPLLTIVTAIAGLGFGEEAARGRLFDQLRGLLGPEGAGFVQSVIARSRTPGSGVLAAALGTAVLALGATAVFGELQAALNVIFRAPPPEGGLKAIVRARLTAFAMVASIGFLLLVSLVLSAVVAALGAFVQGALPVPPLFLHASSFLLSFALTAALFGMMFAILPDVRMRWRDVRVGAVLTAFSFTVGKVLIGLYLGRSAVASTYGAAGALVMVLLWVYYSSVILFFGAELTAAWVRRYGSLAIRRTIGREARRAAPAA